MGKQRRRRLRGTQGDTNSIKLTLAFRADVWQVIREAARLWRQSPKLFIRLAVEFRAADVLNSVPSDPLGPKEREVFRRIWKRSRDPGPLRERDKDDWSADTYKPPSR